MEPPQNKKEEETKPNKRQKETQEQKINKIDIKASEKLRLDAVFGQFCAYEEEPSNDEDSKEKLYKKKIEERANAKRMKQPKSTFVSQTMKKTQKKQQRNSKRMKKDRMSKKTNQRKKEIQF